MTKRDRRRRGPSAIEDVEARAARLGITPDRVLQEYASLAFADLRRIADWGPGEDGLKINPSDELDPADAAAIAEIVAAWPGARLPDGLTFKPSSPGPQSARSRRSANAMRAYS